MSVIVFLVHEIKILDLKTWKYVFYQIMRATLSDIQESAKVEHNSYFLRITYT